MMISSPSIAVVARRMDENEVYDGVDDGGDDDDDDDDDEVIATAPTRRIVERERIAPPGRNGMRVG